jgi:hypothetical protein
MCARAVSPGVKQVWHEADHSSSSIADVKNGGTIHPLPHAPSWHDAELIKHRDNFAIMFVQ